MGEGGGQGERAGCGAVRGAVVTVAIGSRTKSPVCHVGSCRLPPPASRAPSPPTRAAAPLLRAALVGVVVVVVVAAAPLRLGLQQFAHPPRDERVGRWDDPLVGGKAPSTAARRKSRAACGRAPPRRRAPTGAGWRRCARNAPLAPARSAREQRERGASCGAFGSSSSARTCSPTRSGSRAPASRRVHPRGAATRVAADERASAGGRRPRARRALVRRGCADHAMETASCPETQRRGSRRTSASRSLSAAASSLAPSW